MPTGTGKIPDWLQEALKVSEEIEEKTCMGTVVDKDASDTEAEEAKVCDVIKIFSSDEEDVKPVVKKQHTTIPAKAKPLAAAAPSVVPPRQRHTGPVVTKNSCGSMALNLASQITSAFDLSVSAARDDARAAARATQNMVQLLMSQVHTLENQLTGMREEVVKETRRADQAEN